MKQLAILAVCATLLASPARAQTTATTSTSKTAPVTRETIVASVEVDGYFEPVDPFEVRIRTKAYSGDLKIASIASNGAAVKRGDVLLKIDAQELIRQLAEAENALVAARANHERAKADEQLARQSDALALKMAEESLAQAEGTLQWWLEVDGNQMLKQAELGVRQARASVEDQSDELDQLKQMYKTEELTSATADIVVKRAVRSLEISRESAKLAEARESRVKGFDYANSKRALEFAIQQQKQELEKLKSQQQTQQIIRGTATESARIAMERAEAKRADLKSDEHAFTVAAPHDGVVYFGQLNKGNWENANSKSLRPGEKASANQVVMILVTPGRMRIAADVPEAKAAWISPGTAARVVPIALPETARNGSCTRIGSTAGARDGAPSFTAHVEIASVDPRIEPGMKATVRFDAGKAENVLAVPVSAVSKGRVRVRAGGRDVWRDVITGRDDGTLIEIRDGLAENDQVLSDPSK